MDLSELIVLLHYEVQKSYDFVDRVSRTETEPNVSFLHLALEQVELELPVRLEERDAIFDPKKVIGLPRSAQLLQVPYTPDSATKKDWLPNEPTTGKAVGVNIVGPIEKIGQPTITENIGRLKVVLKPILTG
jgi:hypothetical protein